MLNPFYGRPSPPKIQGCEMEQTRHKWIPRVINLKFLLQLHQKYNITQYEELGFQSLLRRKMIILPILTTSLIHFSLKCWENIILELGGERAKTVRSRYRNAFSVWARGLKGVRLVLWNNGAQRLHTYRVYLLEDHWSNLADSPWGLALLQQTVIY